MFDPGDNFNSKDSRLNSDVEKNLDNIDANLSAKSVAIRKKQLEKLFTRLIAFGLACGAVLGIGTYYLLSRLGLDKKPYELEQERIEREQRQEQQQAFFPDITTFPDVSRTQTNIH